jgi:membrane protein CcdC involved in cytochrome C biogenesis
VMLGRLLAATQWERRLGGLVFPPTWKNFQIFVSSLLQLSLAFILRKYILSREIDTQTGNLCFFIILYYHISLFSVVVRKKKIKIEKRKRFKCSHRAIYLKRVTTKEMMIILCCAQISVSLRVWYAWVDNWETDNLHFDFLLKK